VLTGRWLEDQHQPNAPLLVEGSLIGSH